VIFHIISRESLHWSLNIAKIMPGKPAPDPKSDKEPFVKSINLTSWAESSTVPLPNIFFGTFRYKIMLFISLEQFMNKYF
jgi:hypothetical protein